MAVGVMLGMGSVGLDVGLAVGEAVPVGVKIYVKVGKRVAVSVAGSVTCGVSTVGLAVAVGRSVSPLSTRFTSSSPIQ